MYAKCGTGSKPAPHESHQFAVTVMVALLVEPHVFVTRTQYVYVPLGRFPVLYVCVVATGLVVLGNEPLYHW